MEKEHSEWQLRLGLMGFAAMCMVVAIHIPVAVDCSPAMRLFQLFVVRGVCKIAIPLFFIMSGYFLSKHFGEDGWWAHEVRKRVSTLLLPMVLWGCALWIFWSASGVTGDIIHGRKIIINVGLKSVISILGLDPFNQPYMGVFWYARSLFCLVLISPLLIRIANPAGILITWILYGIVHPDYSVPFTKFSFFFHEGYLPLWGAAFFMLGIYIRRNGWLIRLSRKISWLLALVGVAIMLLKALLIYRFPAYSLQHVTWIAIPLLLIGLLNVCNFKSAPLHAYSFPIYALHMFIIMIIGGLVRGILGSDCCLHVRELRVFILIWFSTILASVIVAKAMRIVIPRIAAVMFGGR